MFQLKGGACKKAEPAAEATSVNTMQPEAAISESLTDRQSRSEGVRKRGNNVDADYQNAERSTALSKIQALTGMIVAQEEIETLLCQELDELKNKQAGDAQSLWRLLTRYDEYDVRFSICVSRKNGRRSC